MKEQINEISANRIISKAYDLAIMPFHEQQQFASNNAMVAPKKIYVPTEYGKPPVACELVARVAEGDDSCRLRQFIYQVRETVPGYGGFRYYCREFAKLINLEATVNRVTSGPVAGSFQFIWECKGQFVTRYMRSPYGPLKNTISELQDRTLLPYSLHREYSLPGFTSFPDHLESESLLSVFQRTSADSDAARDDADATSEHIESPHEDADSVPFRFIAERRADAIGLIEAAPTTPPEGFTERAHTRRRVGEPSDDNPSGRNSVIIMNQGGSVTMNFH